MNTREYRNYKRMTKMTVRFLENHESQINSNSISFRTALPLKTSMKPSTNEPDIAPPTRISQLEISEKVQPFSTVAVKKDAPTATVETTNFTKNEDSINPLNGKDQPAEHGRYTNWTSQHTTLATLPWCCIGDLMAFCDKYEYRTLNRNDPQTHNRIVAEVKALLNGQAPFDMRKRFPSDIRSSENLWVCIGRCTGVEYHLNRILSVFRRPMDKLAADKQRMVRHDFHLAVNELRLDISARISEVRLYDRHVFEREFHLEWQDEPLKN